MAIYQDPKSRAKLTGELGRMKARNGQSKQARGKSVWVRTKSGFVLTTRFLYSLQPGVWRNRVKHLNTQERTTPAPQIPYICAELQRALTHIIILFYIQL